MTAHPYLTVILFVLTFTVISIAAYKEINKT